MPTARSPEQPADELLPPNCGPTGQLLAALDAAVAAAFPAFGSLVPNDSADIKGRAHAYLNLPGLLQAVRPALMAQQVIICNTISLVPGGFVVSTMLRHSSGGWRLSQFPVLSLTSSSAISAAATSGFRVNLQLLLASAHLMKMPHLRHCLQLLPHLRRGKPGRLLSPLPQLLTASPPSWDRQLLRCSSSRGHHLRLTVATT
jgi:hypothetical protein